MSLAAASLAGCGRESLLIDLTGGGGAGGSPSTGGGGSTGGTGGTGGSSCVPTTEACNGFDDDCDGDVDEGCSCTDGQSQSCYSGPAGTKDVGPCHAGNQQCKGGAWGPCSGETIPIMELCDQTDNDCDGQVDDGNPEGGGECGLGLAGECAKGVTKCVAGNIACAQAVFPQPETCDGLDNNCNGQTDEGTGSGEDCDTGQPGVCGVGALSCSGGMMSCEPVTGPSPEQCNGLDDNCNGNVDDGNPGGGEACNTGQPGACATGATACQNGAIVCKATNPGFETCNGIDDDCDGTIDDVPQAGNNCFVGGQPPPCNQGKFQCQGNNLVCVPNGNGAAETCNGMDDNCNGQTDEGNPGGGAACSTGIPGACDAGTITCKSGALTCVAASATAELCDGATDEDCNGVAAQVLWSETFASNAAGWTLDQEWAIGGAKASMGQNWGNPDPANDHTSTADNGVAGVVLGGNAQTMPQHPYRYLTSPQITVDPAQPKVWLQYWRWLNSDFSPWMTNRVDVFNAQTNQWETVWQSAGSPGLSDAAWTKQFFDITNKAKGGFVRVRFGFNIQQNGAFVVSQWNVDDVAITTDPCD